MKTTKITECKLRKIIREELKHSLLEYNDLNKEQQIAAQAARQVNVSDVYNFQYHPDAARHNQRLTVSWLYDEQNRNPEGLVNQIERQLTRRLPRGWRVDNLIYEPHGTFIEGDIAWD